MRAYNYEFTNGTEEQHVVIRAGLAWCLDDLPLIVREECQKLGTVVLGTVQYSWDKERSQSTWVVTDNAGRAKIQEWIEYAGERGMSTAERRKITCMAMPHNQFIDDCIKHLGIRGKNRTELRAKAFAKFVTPIK